MTESDRPHAHVSLRSPLPRVGREVVPARREGTRFRLESSPISIMGLAADDLIEEGEHRFVEEFTAKVAKNAKNRRDQ